jgi:hypothetical protein
MRNITETTEPGSEIAHREWKDFFQRFSQDHQEWLVDVVGQGKAGKTSDQANALPFEALTLHLDHTDEVLSVIVRKDNVAKHVYRSIPRPCRVMVEKRGSDEILHIDSIDGSSTVIRFHRVVTPDYESEVRSGIPENASD